MPIPPGSPLGWQSEDLERRAGDALVAFSRATISVSDFSLGQPSVDEMFLALTGTRAEVAA